MSSNLIGRFSLRTITLSAGLRSTVILVGAGFWLVVVVVAGFEAGAAPATDGLPGTGPKVEGMVVRPTGGG